MPTNDSPLEAGARQFKRSLNCCMVKLTAGNPVLITDDDIENALRAALTATVGRLTEGNLREAWHDGAGSIAYGGNVFMYPEDMRTTLLEALTRGDHDLPG